MSIIRIQRDPRKTAYQAGKLAKRLRRQVGQAIADYAMIGEGERVMVCLLGGKDSYGLLDVLLALREKSPVRFELIAVNLDQKQPGFPAQVLPQYLDSRGVPYRIVEQDTYSVVKRVIPEGDLLADFIWEIGRISIRDLSRSQPSTSVHLLTLDNITFRIAQAWIDNPHKD